MFNALRSDELVAGLGRVLRAAAGAKELPDEYARSQLLSAYSITRLLAAEQRASTRLLAWLRGELEQALAPCADSAAATASERIAHATDALAIGDALVDLLTDLRGDGREPQLRTRIHGILRAMTELELAALAGRPEESGEAA